MDICNVFFYSNIPITLTSVLFFIYSNIKLADDKTSNEIIKRGLLEKIFGGVGTQQELPTTP